MIVHNVDDPSPIVEERMRAYGIRSVPTIVIDSKEKVVGVPDFQWFCSEEFYRFLEEKYPLNPTQDSSR